MTRSATFIVGLMIGCVLLAAADTRAEGGALAPEIAALVTMLEAEDAPTRALAARTLGELGAAAAGAMPHLEGRLDDEDVEVRVAVIKAMAAIRAAVADDDGRSEPSAQGPKPTGHKPATHESARAGIARENTLPPTVQPPERHVIEPDQIAGRYVSGRIGEIDIRTHAILDRINMPQAARKEVALGLVRDILGSAQWTFDQQTATVELSGSSKTNNPEKFKLRGPIHVKGGRPTFNLEYAGSDVVGQVLGCSVLGGIEQLFPGGMVALVELECLSYYDDADREHHLRAVVELRLARQSVVLGVVVGSRGEGGVIVEQVHPGQPAARAGFRVRDRLVSLDGTEVESPAHLRELLGRLKPGEKADVVLQRDGREIRLSLHF